MFNNVLHSSGRQGHIYPVGAISQQISASNRAENINFSQILLIVPHDGNFLLFLRFFCVLPHAVTRYGDATVCRLAQ